MKLTPREAQLVALVAREALDSKALAERLGLTEGSLKQLVNRIYKRVGVNRRPQLMLWAHQNKEAWNEMPPVR